VATRVAVSALVAVCCGALVEVTVMLPAGVSLISSAVVGALAGGAHAANSTSATSNQPVLIRNRNKGLFFI
jgi:phage tail sheath protein FI